MKRFIPTYQDCLDICANTKIAIKREDTDEAKEMFVFAPNTHEVNGTEITTFNYGLFSDWKSFVNPIESRPELQALELRGITFVSNGSGYTRYLMLPKFFNLDQHEPVSFHNLKDLPVKLVQEKADGSMIGFIRLDGVLYPRTKNSFTSPQVKFVNDFLGHNPAYQSFIHKCINLELAPVFEICSPLNMIVLNYSETSLPLLQLRDLNTGDLLDIYNHELVSDHEIKVVDKLENLPLSHWVEQAETVTEKEGWVITFENGLMVKVKTVWYWNLHHLVTEVVGRENLLIRAVLENRIDDLLARLDNNDTRIPYTNEISVVTVNEIDRQYDYAVEARKGHSGDRKAFYIKWSNDPLTGIIMNTLPFKDTETGEYRDRTAEELRERIIMRITKLTWRLKEAREFLSTLDVDVNQIRSGVFYDGS